ncbi:MAG: V-type ATPase subunit [Syntrophomonadaceae bacterium]
MGVFADSGANARLRARKSRLRGPRELRLLVAAGSLGALAAALGAEAAREADAVGAALFSGLLDDYAALRRHYPRGAPLFSAVLRLHEVENLKLAWRAHSRAEAPADWRRLWRPLGSLGTLSLAAWSEAVSLRDAAADAAGTPFGPVVAEVLRSRETDPKAAELDFDRDAWEAVALEARRLPAREKGAADLALALVRERDYDLLRRGAARNLTPEAAVAATVVLREEERLETLRSLAAWSPSDGPLSARLPPRLARRLPPVSDWDGLAAALSRRRRDQCLRALRLYPFRLAPPTAYLLLRREEVRCLSALARRIGEVNPPEGFERLLAGSSLEA